MKKIDVNHIPSEYVGVFRKEPSGVIYLRHWCSTIFSEALRWTKR